MIQAMSVLGKRSVTAGGFRGKKKSNGSALSNFYDFLNEFGLHLSTSKDQFNQLNVDQAIFKFRLIQKLHHDFTHEMAHRVCDGFLKHIEKPICFSHCLSATMYSINASSVPIVQESVVRLLLGVEKLQPKMITILLEKMPEFMEESLRDNTLTKEEFQQIPWLVLNQLKWLDCIVDGKELCSKLLEILTIAPVELQRDIITSLPEILDDSAHRTVALHLKELLQSNSQLTSAIVDCFTNLHISDDLIVEILEAALQRVDSASFADLPCLLSFIMQSSAKLDIENIILKLREKLILPSTFVAPIISSTPKGRCTRGMQGGNEFMVFNSLRSIICFQTKVADGWIKVIQGIEASHHHKVIDIFVLFILHSISSRKKPVEILFKNKIRNGLFTEELIGEAFSTHIYALQGCFSSILGIAEVLMRCSASAVRSFAGALYHHTFTCFDVYCQQEVVGTLVSHIGSGLDTEATAALEVLDALVIAKLQDVQRFTLIIKGLLDYLNQMDEVQIRKLYSILITLSFCGEESAASSVQDEVHTVIRKQLSHVDPKYRKMGIIGAMMIIKKVGQSMNDYTVISELDSTQLGSNSQSAPLILSANSSHFKQVLPVLKMVMDLCSRSVESIVLFYDEMASAISTGGIDPGVINFISKKVTSDFQDFFLIDSENLLASIADIPLKYMYGLDSSEEASISLNLLPLVLKQTENFASSLRCLPSHFRLLQAVEAALHHGSLEGIDALLGCPVVACPRDCDYNKLTLSQRETVCFMFFHLINWFRETVTTFSVEKDPEMRAKVIIRLQTITELQHLLEEWINATPTFLPALANLYGDKSTLMLLSGGGGKKARKIGSTSTSKVDLTCGGGKDTAALLDKTCANVSSCTVLQPFWRPFGLSVFNILNYGVLQQVVGNSAEQARKDVEIGPEQLLFLLQDLYNKAKTLTPSFPINKVTTAKANNLGDFFMTVQYDAKELATLVTSVMKVLRQKLNDCRDFFLSQNYTDEIEDHLILSSSNDLSSIMCQQLKVIFQIMSSLLSWPKYSQPECQNLLKEFCLAFNDTVDKSQLTLEQAAINAIQYVGTLSVCLPDICCGYVFIKTLVLLINVTQAVGMKNFVAELSGKLLKKSWKEETSQKRNEAISYLLKYHVAWSQDCLENIEVICANAIPATLEEAEADDDKYQTLTSQTMSCYYRVMMTELVNHLKNVHTICEENSHKLMQLEISARVLSMMIQVVKAFDKRSIFGNALRYGQQYVETFLKSSMPFLDSEFRNNKDEVLQLLKSLQQSTRSMQHFCTHSKVHQDVTLTQHVPALKKSLERLIFRVKDMLCKHNCEGAFWMGNLKNRDLQGNEILSQSQSIANVTNQEVCAQTEEVDENCSSSSERVVDDGDGENLSLDEE